MPGEQQDPQGTEVSGASEAPDATQPDPDDPSQSRVETTHVADPMAQETTPHSPPESDSGRAAGEVDQEGPDRHRPEEHDSQQGLTSGMPSDPTSPSV